MQIILYAYVRGRTVAVALTFFLEQLHVYGVTSNVTTQDCLECICGLLRVLSLSVLIQFTTGPAAILG